MKRRLLCHAQNMRPESVSFQPVRLPQSN
jgi:hypothetical protein